MGAGGAEVGATVPLLPLPPKGLMITSVLWAGALLEEVTGSLPLDLLPPMKNAAPAPIAPTPTKLPIAMPAVEPGLRGGVAFKFGLLFGATASWVPEGVVVVETPDDREELVGVGVPD